MPQVLDVRGAKGGDAPYEANDTLKSTQRAEIVDLLGEGQIGGLVNGLKSVYLDGVPVENADGSRNFAEFGYRVTLGGPTLEADAAFGDVQTEVGVGVTVLAAVPVVRTVTDTTADKLRVTITVPQLAEQTAEGNRVGAAFDWAIDVQSNGGGYVQKWAETISGKASSPYSRAVVVSLREVGPPPWDVRVRRVSADSTNANLVNAFSWASYTVISGVRMLYRHSAVVALQFDAKNFTAVPQRWYDVMGVSDWDIPVNYNPLTRTVAGSWNGLWKQGWTNNPAWVLYNLVKHPRYGLGEYVTTLPDKWALYQLALWCDEPLSDGRGGTEPRYSINAYITEQREALLLLQEICSVFRGVLMHGGSTLTVTWDAPGTPVASYAPANVVDGIFTYADGSSAAKKTSCTCWYTDRSQAGKRVPATWDDPELVAKYGLRPMEINPLGVATPGQALRMAKWALYTAHYEEQTIAFRVGAEGPARRLGEVFQVTDPAEAGERLGGRIIGSTTNTVQLDAPVTLAAGETYTLWVTQPHATKPDQVVQEARTVTTGVGSTLSLTVSPAFSQAPRAGTVWLLEGSNVAPTLWRYVAINEVEADVGGARQYDVMGVRHEPGKWALIEQDQPLSLRPTRRLSYAVGKPQGLTVAEVVYLDGAVQRIRATVSWTVPAPGLRYLVAWRLARGPWLTLPLTTANTVDVDNLQPGLFEVMVRSQNGLGITSLAAEASLVLTGQGSVPVDVTGLQASQVQAGVRISWNPHTASNAGETELRTGASWAAGTPLWRGRASGYTMVAPAAGAYTVWAKHRDLTGRLESANAAMLTFNWDGINLLTQLSLVVDSQIFKVDSNGAGSPSSITLLAQGQNLPGAPTFTVVAGTATLAGSGTSRVLGFSQMTTDLVTVEVAWGTLTDRVSIFKVRDGSDGYTWLLTNESQAVACDATGAVLAGQLPLTSQYTVLRGATVLTSGVTYAVGTVVGLTGVSITASGAITVTGVTADSASAEFLATIGTTVLKRKLTVTKIRPGARGQSNHRIYIAAPFATQPATPDPTSNGATPLGWSAAPVAVVAGQAQWQSDGTTPEGSTVTTWSTPYLSYFKVAQLSAITADIGTITAGTLSGVTFNVLPGGGINFNAGAAQLAKFFQDGLGHFVMQNLVANKGLSLETRGASGGASKLLMYTSDAQAAGVYDFQPPVFGGSSILQSSSPITIQASNLTLGAGAGSIKHNSVSRFYQELVMEGGSNHIRMKPVPDSWQGTSVLFRNDSVDFYILKTVENNADGGWSSERPFRMKLSFPGFVEIQSLRLLGHPNDVGSSSWNLPGNTKPGSATWGQWRPIWIDGVYGHILFWPLN